MSKTPKWEDSEELPQAAAPTASVPTWEDTIPDAPVEKGFLMSMADRLRDTGMSLGQSTNDLALGTAQGASLGFADELEGLGRATVDSAIMGKGINPMDPEFMKKYREFQQIADKRYDEADERSPILTGLGNVVGGVMTAPAMGAFGLASSGGRLAVKEALKSGGKMAAAKVAAKEAGKDALVSIPAGAGYGAGMSDATIDTAEGRDELLGDTLEGGAMGGILGATIGAATSVLPNVSDAAFKGIKGYVDEMDGPLSRIIKKSYKYGQDGLNLSDQNVQNRTGLKSKTYSEELMGDLDKADEMFGKEVGKTIEAAEAAGQKINVDESLNAAAQKIEEFLQSSRAIELDPKSKDIVGRILTLDATISPSEAQHIRKTFGMLSEKYAGRQDVILPVLDAFQTVQKGLKEAMSGIPETVNGVTTYKGGIPGYGEASKNFAQYRQNIPEQVIAGYKDPGLKGVQMGILKNPEYKLQDSIENMVKGATVDGGAARDQRQAFTVIKDKLLKLKETNPEAFKAMGRSAEDIIVSITDAGDTEHMLGAFMKQNPHEGFKTAAMKNFTGLMGTGKSTMVGIANKAGMYGPKILDKAGAPMRFTKKMMFDLPLESVEAVANHLAGAESTAIRNMGEALQKAVANKDAVGKNAVLFSIMQNPNTRKMLDFEDDVK